MDLREKKTERSIRNAFMELRAHMPLERIRVKDLTDLAEISKGTFYLHYKDVYDLSEKMQDEVIMNMMNSIPHPEAVLDDQPTFTKELFYAYLSQKNLISILFSGSQESVLPSRIEQEIFKQVQALRPESMQDQYESLSLTYQVFGGYFSFHRRLKEMKEEDMVRLIGEFSEKISRK